MTNGIPQSIGKYRIDSVVGEGAMGVVYLGHDPDIDRIVAIKTLHTHLIDTSERASWLERFAREAKAAGKCLHGNLVTIFDYLERDEQPYLVMEYIESETLADRIARRPLPNLQEFGSIMTQMLAGLDAIHAVGIVHRDVKPANALLLPDGRVKLADFGVARVEALGATNGGMIGTPDYMSPEQFMGNTADQRADIFAAGVIMFELLTGRKPFESKSLGELTQRVISGQSLNLRELAPDLPDKLYEISRCALQADPANRIPNARSFANALLEAMRNLDRDVLDDTNRTIVSLPSAPAPVALSQTLAQQMPKSTLAKIESLLTSQIGPIAKILVRRVSGATTDTGQLIDKLAAEIGPEHREAFKAAVRQHLGQTGVSISSGITTSGHSPELLEALIKYLTPHLGPIAKVLVNRTAKSTRTRDELCTSLAGHIDDETSRAQFLQTMA